MNVPPVVSAFFAFNENALKMTLKHYKIFIENEEIQSLVRISITFNEWKTKSQTKEYFPIFYTYIHTQVLHTHKYIINSNTILYMQKYSCPGKIMDVSILFSLCKPLHCEHF